MKSESIPVTKLKAHLSRYLAKARSGTVVEVTAHNRPIARIVGVGEPRPEGLSRLIAEGGVTPGDGRPLRLGPPIRLAKNAPLVSDLVSDERGER